MRGRDSAGIQFSLTLKDRETLGRIIEEIRGRGLHGEFLRRSVERDLLNGAIHVADHRHPDGGVYLSFVYKTASIIGKLGENVRKLREAIRADGLFHAFAREGLACVSALDLCPELLVRRGVLTRRQPTRRTATASTGGRRPTRCDCPTR